MTPLAALAVTLSLVAAQAVAAQSVAQSGAQSVAQAVAPPPGKPSAQSSGRSREIANSQDTVQARGGILRGLDTLSGETRDMTLAIGQTERLGYLEITLDACRVPRAEPESDAYAFLRIRDVREDQPRFSGWMFASSPALSALDHPRYDVWVLSCSSV